MVRQFYLSEEYVQAEEMAKFKAVIEGGSPMVNEFFFDEEFLDSDELRVCCFEDYSEEWHALSLQIVMQLMSLFIIMTSYMNRSLLLAI